MSDEPKKGPKLRLYLLQRRDIEAGKHHCDEALSMVVRQTSRQKARKEANENCGDEGMIWSDPTKVACAPLSREGKPGVIIRNYRSG